MSNLSESPDFNSKIQQIQEIYKKGEEKHAQKLNQAQIELQNVKTNWDKIIQDLSQDKIRQIPREEGNRIRHNLNNETDRIRIFYAPHEDREFALEVQSVMNQLAARLDIALLDGKRRYEHDIHRRKMETIREWGVFLNNIKFNIVSFIIGIITTIGIYWRH